MGWSVVARVAAGLAAVAVAVWMWTDHQTGDRIDPPALADQVKTSMQQKLSTDPMFTPYGLTVQDVTLAQSGDTTYKGVADVKARSGTSGQVPVDVTYDDHNLVWNTQPGAFLFLLQDQAAEAVR